MIPKTISASSLKVASLCLERWKAEYLNGGRQLGNEAADLGTTLHLALEMYVQAAIMKRTKWPTLEFLLDCYKTAYIQIMKSFDFGGELFDSGDRMMRVWFERNDFEGFEVLSTEIKESFEVPYRVDGVKQMMRFNYICDRVDMMRNGQPRVVDYKSWRGLKTPDDIQADLQARMYALAMQIKFPTAPRIWVMIDQLRGEEVGYFFTRDDNAETFRALKKVLQRIVDADANELQETLNEECGYCIRKSKCNALAKHQDAGGTLGMKVDDLIRLRYEAQTREAANKRLKESLDPLIKFQFDTIDLRELDTLDNKYHANLGAGKSINTIDVQQVVRTLGIEILLEVANIKKIDIDKLIGDPRFTPAQWAELKKAIKTQPGKRSMRVTKKKKSIVEEED